MSFYFVCPPAYAANGVTIDPSRTLYTARQVGMGGVSIGFANDASGIFANPAELNKLEFPQLAAASRKLSLGETQYSLFGWVVPTNYGNFGLGFVGMETGGSLPTMLDPATGRIIINPSLEAGSYSNSVIALSYSREIEKPYRIGLGGNLKFFSQIISGSSGDSATGMGIDLSASYRPLPWLKVGALLQNFIGGSVKWATTEDKLGGFYRIGSEILVMGPSGEALRPYPQEVRAGIDLELPNSVMSSGSSLLYHAGVEYFPVKNIALRAGLNQDQNGSGIALGIGVVNGGFRFDYAYSQRPGLPGDLPHYFTLSYVGERVLKTSRDLKLKLARYKFSSPKDRLITDQPVIDVSAEAWVDKTLEQKRVWTVTAISATQDAFDVSERERVSELYLNGRSLGAAETVEASENLQYGRNVIRLIGLTSAEGKIAAAMTSGEVKVLRITPFADVSMESWAIEPISLNVVIGLITGYPNNTFKPEKGITRAELVTLLVRSLGVPAVLLDSYNTFEAFSDVSAKHWAAKYIVYGNTLNYVTGYPDGTFKPNRVLSRAEGITIMARYAGLTEEAGAIAPFADLKPEFWANKFINPAKSAGLLKYLAGKKFNQKAPFTRAEAAEVLYRVSSIQQKVDEFWETGAISSAK